MISLPLELGKNLKIASTKNGNGEHVFHVIVDKIRGSSSSTAPLEAGISHVIVDNFPVGGTGLTNTELRASAVAVSLATQPLPTGAATEATLAGVLTNTQLRASPLGVTVSGVVEIANDSGSPIPVSAATLPLPSGASTEATVASLLTLAGFQARIPTPGQAAMAASLPVVIANNQSGIPVIGTFFQPTQPVSAASLPLPSGASTEATLGTLLTLAGFQARIPILGQAAMAVSIPVTLANNQSAVPVSGTFFQATQPVSLAGNQAVNVVQMGGTAISMNTGVRDAGTQRVTIATNDSVPVTGTFFQPTQPISAASLPLPAGAATETTLGTMLTLSGFQARIPVLGQAAMAVSVPVTIANNQSAFPVTGSGNFAITAAALPLPTGATTEATLATLLTLADFQARIPANGQAAMAASIPVVLASNHTTVTIGGNTSAGTPSPTTVLTVQGHGSGTAMPVSLSTLPALVAGTANIGDVDVLTLPALPAGTNNIGDVDVLTLPALPAGTNRIGSVRVVDSADADLTSAKGAQTTRAIGVQELKDAGRNQTNFFHAVPIITTTAEVMQTLTGYKSGAAVAATATPAVVTPGKTYRITSITITYWAATVIGGARINLRANLSGVAVVGSPLVKSYQVGIPAVFTAGSAMTYVFPYPDGIEFAAGTGIAIGVIGEGAVPTTGTITGYVMVLIEGYEY